MKQIIIAKNKGDLLDLIDREIRLNGDNCNLNHIDVSKIENMSELFKFSSFNGDISQWNTSRVTNMAGMFYGSKFNGDIANWNVSRVKTMDHMFTKSDFNGDISKWDVSNVVRMNYMFYKSDFNQDLSDWKPYNLLSLDPQDIGLEQNMFDNNVPYWATIEETEKRNLAIDNYWLKKDLDKNLVDNTNQIKKVKI